MGITGFSDFASIQTHNNPDQDNTNLSEQPVSLNSDPQQLQLSSQNLNSPMESQELIAKQALSNVGNVAE